MMPRPIYCKKYFEPGNGNTDGWFRVVICGTDQHHVPQRRTATVIGRVYERLSILNVSKTKEGPIPVSRKMIENCREHWVEEVDLAVSHMTIFALGYFSHAIKTR